MFAAAPCWSCGQLFTFDPDKVPSIPIDPHTNMPADLGGDVTRAVKQPVCPSCVEQANELRAAEGRPLIEVLPGAYEATDTF